MRLVLVGLAAAAGTAVYHFLGGGPIASGVAAVIRALIRGLS